MAKSSSNANATLNQSNSLNRSSWIDNPNHDKFLEALVKFMNKSWETVSQLREKAGLSSSYGMDPVAAEKKIQEIAQKIDAKRKEVSGLQRQKCELMARFQSMQGTTASSGLTNQANYSQSYDRNATAQGSSYASSAPSTTADEDDEDCPCEDDE